MKKFFTTLKNIWSIVELRDRLLITLGYLVIFRLGSFIVLPGIDPVALKEFVGQGRGGLFGLLDTFLGGAFSKASIFGLGIMPYISASIVVQLLTVSMPYFQKMQKEGDSGRKRINQITRVLTIIICMSQSIMYIKGTIPTEAITVSPTIFTLLSMVILTSGTIFCMWLGEKITDKGIGNGISMLIMIGIISSLPSQLIGEATSKGLNGALLFILEIVALFFVIMGVVALTQAVRKIPVQYAKQIVRNKVYGGQRQYIPLKVNSAGVMPIIFAQALMFIPGGLGSYFADKNEFISGILYSFSSITSVNYNILLAVLIIVFTFFYTAITINPTQIADDMKRNGGFIPGIKPGKQTSEFIDRILTKVTLPGSFFLAIVAILPAFAMMANVQQGFAYFYGGTSLLIMVGVILDTLQQIESYLLMRHYEGMMKSGKIKGRSQVAVA